MYSVAGPGRRRLLVSHVTQSGGLTLGHAWRQTPSKCADPVSLMVKEHTLSMRYRAVGMVNGGLTQVQVTKQLKKGPRILKRWIALDCRGETLENLQGRGLKTP